MVDLPAEITAVIERGAAPVNPQERSRFIETVTTKLQRYEALGPGIVHRVIAETQRAFPIEARRTSGYEPHRRALVARPRSKG
jgi:hypothetical protein